MSISSMMNASVSGMAAQANRLATASDNIANLDTVGYKRAKADFSTVVLPSTEQKYNAGGVLSNVSNVIGEQGALKATTSNTDLAITGSGFFVVQSNSGDAFLTRAGAFALDAEGFLVNSAGYKLLGYPANQAGGAVNSAEGLEPVQVGGTQLQSNPTTNGTFVVNLPADATAVVAANQPSANAASAEFAGKTSMTVFDNLGRPVTLDIYSAKVAPETWEVSVFDASTADATSGSFPYTSGPLTSDTLTFDATTGELDAGSVSSLSIPVPNGATMPLDLTGTSQLAGGYVVLGAQANGGGASVASGTDISADGTLFTIFDDGSRQATFRIPLARVASPDGLESMTGNVFTPTLESGSLQIGDAASGGLGEIVSGALEGSTVEVSDELVGLIQAERHYTANSKVFQTSSEILEVLVNLKR